MLTRSDDPAIEQYEVALWDMIAATSKATSFGIYSEFLDPFFDNPVDPEDDDDNRFLRKKRNSAIRRPVSLYGLDAWDLVTTATDIFVRHQAAALGDVDWRSENIPPDDGGREKFPDNVDRERQENVLLAQVKSHPRLATYLELVRTK